MSIVKYHHEEPHPLLWMKHTPSRLGGPRSVREAELCNNKWKMEIQSQSCGTQRRQELVQLGHYRKGLGEGSLTLGPEEWWVGFGLVGLVAGGARIAKTRAQNEAVHGSIRGESLKEAWHGLGENCVGRKFRTKMWSFLNSLWSLGVIGNPRLVRWLKVVLCGL